MLQDIVKNLCTNDYEFYQFAYELRKYDQTDKYTKDLVQDHLDELTIFILLSNKWDVNREIMEIQCDEDN